ncbi:unnamed protein product, partial [Timema podura]|nr:unnamed protein product [Timema podura]
RVLTVLGGKYNVLLPSRFSLLTDAQVEDIAKAELLLVYKGISKISKTAILTFEGKCAFKFAWLYNIEAFVSRDSGWIYDGTLEMRRINVSKNLAFSIEARVQIPEVMAKRRALINKQSEEELWFPVSVLTCLFEPMRRPQRF